MKLLCENLLVIVIAFLSLVSKVDGFAKFMTTEYCSRAIEIGSVIMGEAMIASDQHRVIVQRGSDILDSGSVYVPGEELLVTITKGARQYVFESTNGLFKEGGCYGMRISNGVTAVLQTPTIEENNASGLSDISVVAAWANGYGTVKLSPIFTLIAAAPSISSQAASNSDSAPDL